jgi:APA family basic amino acid/polyamine antiporter
MPASARREVADAVVLGLAAMWGTGLFVVFAPAAELAGGWLPLAVLIAGLVALAAGFAESDLAAGLPDAGGRYRYARERLSPGLARLTGVAGLAGRIASAAAAALVFGDYVLPAHPVCVALPLIVVLGALIAAGARWSVRGAWVLVPGLLFVLIAVVVSGLTQHVPAEWSATGTSAGGMVDPTGPVDRLGAVPGVPVDAAADGPTGRPAAVAPEVASDRSVAQLPGPAPGPGTPSGVLGAAGLMFFAFLGFSAVPATGGAATGGAATRGAAAGASGPSASSTGRRRTRLALPLAVLAALTSYLAVALALAHTLGMSRTAVEAAPLVAAVGGADTPALGVLVRVGAAAATGCALFAMLGGAGGTAAAMAVRNDLPGRLGLVGPRGRPWRADLAVVALSVLLVALVTPVQAVVFSACAALVHYALVGLASLRLPPGERRWPRWIAALTPPLCLGLAVLLPRPESVIAGVALASGWLISTAVARRAVARRTR